MRKSYLITLGLIFMTVVAVQAQTKTSLTYAVGFPTADLGDFISTVSWRGANLDFRQMVQEDLGVGMSLAWQVFYEEVPHDTYESGTAALSGKQYRYSNHVPMMAAADKYLSQGQRINPFVGLGTGVMYTRRNTDMNLYTVEQEAWNFLLQPEFGVEIDNNVSFSFTIIAKYLYGFKAGDLDKPQSYISLNVGWTFKS